MTTPKRRRGRPARPDARKRCVFLRVSDDEHAALTRIARDNQQTVTDFIREAVIEAAADCTDETVLAQA